MIPFPFGPDRCRSESDRHSPPPPSAPQAATALQQSAGDGLLKDLKAAEEMVAFSASFRERFALWRADGLLRAQNWQGLVELFASMGDQEEVAAAALERLSCQLLQALASADVKKRGPGTKQLREFVDGIVSANPPVAGFELSRGELLRLWRLARGPQSGSRSAVGLLCRKGPRTEGYGWRARAEMEDGGGGGGVIWVPRRRGSRRRRTSPC